MSKSKLNEVDNAITDVKFQCDEDVEDEDDIELDEKETDNSY